MRAARWASLVLIAFVLGVVLGYLIRPGAPGLNWLVVLACFVLSGASGGVIAAFQWEDISKLMAPDQDSWWSKRKVGNILTAVGISALGGGGGAIAAMALMIAGGKFEHNGQGGGSAPISDKDLLTYIATGVVAGFVGFQIMKRVALNLLSEKVEQVKAATDENKARLEETMKKLALSHAVIRGMRAVDEKSGSPAVEAAIADLRKALEHSPGDRAANAMLGRLLDEKQNDPSEAIDVLQKGLAAMEREGTTSPTDRVDLCWNIAAYYLEMSRNAERADPEQAKRWKDQTIRFLRKANELDPSVGSAAAADPDFKDLRFTGDRPLSEAPPAVTEVTVPPAAPNIEDRSR
jgi:hypothetical protein